MMTYIASREVKPASAFDNGQCNLSIVCDTLFSALLKCEVTACGQRYNVVRDISLQ